MNEPQEQEIQELPLHRQDLEALFQTLKNQENFPADCLEEIFLIGKLTSDEAVQAEIGEILAKNFDKMVGKAYKSRKKFPKPEKFYPYLVMETLLNYGKHSLVLDLGKMYGLLGFDSIYVSDSQKWTVIPEELTRFGNLREFKLSSYARMKTLPDYLDKLTNLEEVELESLDNFPMFVTRLPKLKKLEMKLGYMPSLPAELFDCESLEELDLQATTGWSSQGINPNIVFRTSLRKLKNLQKLELYYFVQDSLPDDFFEGLENLKHLRMGRFSNLKRLPASIRNLQNLEILEFNVMESLEELPKEIAELKTLKVIDLGTLGNVRIPIEIFSLPNLETIKFYNMGGMQIQTGEASVSNLKRFRVDNDEMARFFWQNFELFRNLEDLDLAATTEFPEIPDKIAELKHLRTLYVHGTALTHITDKIGELTKLESLSIRGANNLPALPAGLRHLTGLKSLHINSGASISLLHLVCHASTLPASPDLDLIVECKEFVADLDAPHPLKKLKLSTKGVSQTENWRYFDNLKHLEMGFMDEIPEAVGLLKNLEYLSCDSRKSDTLPASVGKLQNLKKLVLWGDREMPINHIPKELSQLKKLEHLYISNYGGAEMEHFVAGLESLETLECHTFPNITSLPVCLGKLPRLRELVLYSCEKLEEAGETLAQLKHLKRLQLYFSKLKSDNIEAITKLTQLERLELRYWNNLEELPASIVNLQHLQDLRLNNVKITTIPAYIGELKKLHTLALDGLVLDTLPASLADLPLTRMSIGCTWFRVALPEELKALRLKKLELWQSKFAGNNQKRSMYDVLISAGTQIVKNIDTES